SGGATGTANPVSVTINGNTAVTANYTQDEYTLTITSAHGTVTRSPDQATYHYGDVVQLTAAADMGWTFASWSGGATGTANPVSVTINGNTAITANYTQNEYTLTITSAHGTVTQSPNQAAYHYGDIVQLTVTPDPAWRFTGWSGDASGDDNPLSITITGNMSVTANYAEYLKTYIPLIFK
ncbi:MAG: cell wall-binding protein, partial [Anaerolineaceae bacterium]